MSSGCIDETHLRTIHDAVIRELEQASPCMDHLAAVAKARAISEEKLHSWPVIAKLVANRVLSSKVHDSIPHATTVGQFLLHNDLTTDELMRVIDVLADSFFANEPEIRLRLHTFQNHIHVRHEDMINTFMAYTFFFQEQWYPYIRIETLDEPSKTHLFEALWYLFLCSKCHLLGAQLCEVMESNYVLLSILNFFQKWASGVDLLQPDRDTSSASLSYSGPLEYLSWYEAVNLSSIQEICTAKISSWQTFNQDHFVPYATSVLEPLLLKIQSSDTQSRNLQERRTSFRAGIAKLHEQSKALFLTCNPERLEFEEHKLLKEFPMHHFYQPPPVPSSLHDASPAAKLVPSPCALHMHQVHCALHELVWLHTYIDSPHKTPVSGATTPVSQDGNISSSLKSVVLSELIPEEKIVEIKAKSRKWKEKIMLETDTGEIPMNLVEGFYFRLLLNIFANESHSAANESEPLFENDKFLATLYGGVFEVVMYVIGRSEFANHAFPYIVGALNLASTELLQVIGGASGLLRSAPKIVTNAITALEEKVTLEQVWRKESPLFTSYSEGTQSLFSYILSNAGPPHQPRKSIYLAITDPSMVEKFKGMWQESGPGPMPINWYSYYLLIKLLRIACTRVRSACKMLPFFSSNAIATTQVELAMSHIITQKLPIMVDRHIDTIAMCTIHAIAIVHGIHDLHWRTIAAVYESLVFHSDASLNFIPVVYEGEKELSLIPLMDFNNFVFVPLLSSLLVRFRPQTIRSADTSSPTLRRAPTHEFFMRADPTQGPPSSSPALNNGDTSRYTSNPDMSPSLDRSILPATQESLAPTQPLPSSSQQSATTASPSSAAASSSQPHHQTQISRSSSSSSQSYHAKFAGVARKLQFDVEEESTSSQQSQQQRSPSTRTTRSQSRTTPPRPALLPIVNTPPRTRAAISRSETEEEEENEIGLAGNGPPRAPSKRRSPPPSPPAATQSKKPRYR